jgi:pimeloyl-ACP methyl ester carboxylesterase
MSRARTALRAVGILLASALGLVLISAAVNAVLTAAERRAHPAPGRMVEVPGAAVHVLVEGRGGRSVVLLTGFGVSSPTGDFRPLVDALRDDFTVAVAECPGYGWSGWTRRPRTNENIVQELRLALREAGVPPPYTLVPYSLSGIYVLHWALSRPGEIQAIVCIDTTVPAQGRYYRSGIKRAFDVSLLTALRVSGACRWISLLDRGYFRRPAPSYSDEDRRLISMQYVWDLGNRAQWNEYMALYDNLSELQGRRFPADIPIRMLVARENLAWARTAYPGLDWLEAHRDIVAGCGDSQLLVLDGLHALHWESSPMIAGIVREAAGRAWQQPGNP